MNTKLLNNYVLIRVNKPIDKIGSIFVPDSAKVRFNQGVIVQFSDKITAPLNIGDNVWFVEYTDTAWIDNDHCMTPYESLNATQGENGKYNACGSKILVVIDKQKQKSNRLVGSLQLFMPDFNNNYAFNNQYGTVGSVGCYVEEKIQPGDVAIFHQFTESSNHTHIATLENGDEIRFVECGTNANYELYGFIHEDKFIASKNYVFVEPPVKNDFIENNGIIIDSSILNKNKMELHFTHTVLHDTSDGEFLKGDEIVCRGKSSEIDNLHIHKVARVLIDYKVRNN